MAGRNSSLSHGTATSRAFLAAALVASCVVVSLLPSRALAVCTSGGTIFPIFQCGFQGWFAPPPAGAGTVSAVWWQLSYGNLALNNGFGGAQEGTGIGPTSPLTFSGNDSGLTSIVLTDVSIVVPGAPTGGLCSRFENSWGLPNVDGCPDNPRTGNGYDNDNVLNPFWGGVLGPGYLTYNYQLDYPMAFLLREGSGRFFSWGIVASRSRNNNPSDTTSGVFSLADVQNGDLNPISGENDVIPWQAVPKPNVDVAVLDIGTNTVDLALSWDNVEVHSDQSTRPSPRLTDAGGGSGVGVADQGALVRYRLERLDLNTLPPGSVNPTTGAIDPNVLNGAAFTPVPGVPNPVPAPPGPTVNVSLLDHPRNYALRVRTLLGKDPRTSTISLANCRVGRCGDLGAEPTACGAPGSCPVSPPLTIIGGSLISERAVEMRASKQKGQVTVTFRTTSEQTVTGIEILAVGNKGDFLVRSVEPQQGSSGIGAGYEVTLGSGELKGAKELKVRLNGPNFTSAPFSVVTAGPRTR